MVCVYCHSSLEAAKLNGHAVIQFAKKTGDYSVLSHADLLVLALTYDLHLKAEADKEAKEGSQVCWEFHVCIRIYLTYQQFVPSSEAAVPEPVVVVAEETEAGVQNITEDLQHASLEDNIAPPEDLADQNASPVEHDLVPGDEKELESLEVELHQETPSPTECPVCPISTPGNAEDVPLYDDPSDSDDGDGEWITPSNVALHKSRALDMLPSADASRRAQDEEVIVGCMTADFAMQNVLLQMGLSLVGVEGKRIRKVKTWVLRCHACFK